MNCLLFFSYAEIPAHLANADLKCHSLGSVHVCCFVFLHCKSHISPIMPRQNFEKLLQMQICRPLAKGSQDMCLQCCSFLLTSPFLPQCFLSVLWRATKLQLPASFVPIVRHSSHHPSHANQQSQETSSIRTIPRKHQGRKGEVRENEKSNMQEQKPFFQRAVDLGVGAMFPRIVVAVKKQARAGPQKKASVDSISLFSSC